MLFDRDAEHGLAGVERQGFWRKRRDGAFQKRPRADAEVVDGARERQRREVGGGGVFEQAEGHRGGMRNAEGWRDVQDRGCARLWR